MHARVWVCVRMRETERWQLMDRTDSETAEEALESNIKNVRHAYQLCTIDESIRFFLLFKKDTTLVFLSFPFRDSVSPPPSSKPLGLSPCLIL